MEKDELMNQNNVAEVLGISTKTLEAMRQKGTGPMYHKFGRRVLYSSKCLREYLDDRTFRSTSEYK